LHKSSLAFPSFMCCPAVLKMLVTIGRRLATSRKASGRPWALLLASYTYFAPSMTEMRDEINPKTAMASAPDIMLLAQPRSHAL
jgi:hypothetical protein